MKHNNEEEFVVSVGADYSRKQVETVLSTVFKDIVNIVSNPEINHFSINVTPLRKGSRSLANAGIIYKNVPEPPTEPKKKTSKKKK